MEQQPSPAADRVRALIRRQAKASGGTLTVGGILALLDAFAGACAVELEKAGGVLRPEVMTAQNARWRLILLALPVPPDRLPGLTPCDKDCLAVLGQAREPLSADDVRRAFRHGTYGVKRSWGLATIKRSLARLKADGVICNRLPGRPGYYLEANLPLFR